MEKLYTNQLYNEEQMPSLEEKHELSAKILKKAIAEFNTLEKSGQIERGLTLEEQENLDPVLASKLYFETSYVPLSENKEEGVKNLKEFMRCLKHIELKPEDGFGWNADSQVKSSVLGGYVPSAMADSGEDSETLGNLHFIVTGVSTSDNEISEMNIAIERPLRVYDAKYDDMLLNPQDRDTDESQQIQEAYEKGVKRVDRFDLQYLSKDNIDGGKTVVFRVERYPNKYYYLPGYHYDSISIVPPETS